MPTVLRQNGFRVMINTHDHEPPHVHCVKAGAEVLINIETSSVRRSKGMATHEIRKAVQLVEDNADRLMAEWRKVFPS